MKSLTGALLILSAAVCLHAMAAIGMDRTLYAILCVLMGLACGAAGAVYLVYELVAKPSGKSGSGSKS